MDHNGAPGFFDDLDATLAHAWALLARGVADRRSSFHTPTLVTAGVDGVPNARTLVLRACDPANRLLRFHSDARSRKVAEIARDPRVSVHVYDARSKVQLRMKGRAMVMEAGSATARAAWAASQPKSRAGYAQMLAPGAALEAPAEGEVRDAAGDINFNVIRTEIDALEWLYLHHAGHRRARFAWTTQWRGQWLAP